MTFWGKIMLVSFAVGVVTGIVQEFQFGMNWSTYSRFVGDVFGAPLAMEGLAAFFVESTFIGLWIFGKGRLSPRVHLATIWAVALATMLSAYFIIAANSWMQHPVGSRVDASGQARLTSIWDVLFQSTAVWSFIHVIAAAWITGTVVVIAVAASGTCGAGTRPASSPPRCASRCRSSSSACCSPSSPAIGWAAS